MWPADPPFLTAQDSCSCSTHWVITNTTASQNQDFFTLIPFKKTLLKNRHVMNKWSAFSKLVKFQPPHTLWLYGKWLLHFSSKRLCSSAGGGTVELPEGVSEVHTPSLQLLRVVGRHVGELSEDVEVRGVSWWGRRKTKQNTECKMMENDSTERSDSSQKRKKKSLTWFFWSVKTSFIWNLWAEELWVRKRRRHREASLFQLSGFWAFTFLVAMVTAESTDTTKAVEVFCVPWELPGPAN